MSSQAVEGLPALGLIVAIGAIAFVGVVLMIANLCRQLVAQMRGESVGYAVRSVRQGKGTLSVPYEGAE
jgi:hypothetical protein